MTPGPPRKAAEGLMEAEKGLHGVSGPVTLWEKGCSETPHDGGRIGSGFTIERCNKPGFPPAGLEGGQAMAEFAFAFPLQLFVMFAIIQLALLYVAKEVVSYASFSAARAAIVAESPEEALEGATQAAALVCAPITGTTVTGSGFSLAYLTSAQNMIAVPGWGPVPGSGISRHLKTVVARISYPRQGEVEVTVTHYFELMMPGVNHIFAWLAELGTSPPPGGDAVGPLGTTALGREADFEQRHGIWNVQAPHMRIRETTRLAMPGAY